MNLFFGFADQQNRRQDLIIEVVAYANTHAWFREMRNGLTVRHKQRHLHRVHEKSTSRYLTHR